MPSAVAGGPGRFSTVRVVIADDQALVRSGFRLILGSAGIDVVAEAADGLAAVAATLKHRPDVVLMDIRMPEAEDIVASCMTDSDGRRPIFIAMTMSGRNNFREIHLSEGMDHSIDKPVDRDELILQLKACSVLTGNRRIRAAG